MRRPDNTALIFGGSSLCVMAGVVDDPTYRIILILAVVGIGIILARRALRPNGDGNR